MASNRPVRKRFGLILPAIFVPLLACQLIAGLGGDLTERSSRVTDTDAAQDAAQVGADVGPGPDGSTTNDGSQVSAYAAAVLADKPVAFYRFFEQTGALCKDSSGNGNDAFLTGAFVRGRPSLVADIGGKSVGLGGGATLPLDPKFDFALIQNFTFEFWFRGELIDAGELLGNTSWDSVAQTQTGTTFFNGSKATAVERWAGAAGQLAFARAFTFVPTPGDSLFFAVVSASGTPTLYINGVAYAGTLEANPTDASVMNGPLVLARQVAGEYGELAIYDHALAATQIAAHYSAGQPN